MKQFFSMLAILGVLSTAACKSSDAKADITEAAVVSTVTIDLEGMT